MANYKLTHADLAHFTGTTTWYRHPLKRDVLYTDGIQYLAEQAEAYWLVDEIAFWLGSPEMRKAVQADERIGEMQFWRLEVAEDESAVLTCCADKGVAPVVKKPIPWTSFPLRFIDIWASFDGERWVLYLPSEH